MLAMVPSMASAAPLWFDNGAFSDPNPNDLTHHIELEDIDNDGDVDLIVVNNSDENLGNAGSMQLNRVYLNDGGTFTEDPTVFQTPDNARVVKLRDVNGDGNADVVAGATWSGTSYIMFGDGNGAFAPGGSTPDNIRVGSLDLGDVDDDGDLDIVVSDYGSKAELGGVDDPGAPLQLWLNDGSGNFTNSGLLPTDMGSHVAYSWSVNFVDVDNDFDFDIVASSAGGGTDTPQDLDTFPQTRIFINDNMSFTELENAEFGPLKICRGISFVDFNNDLYLDAFTLQDGGTLNEEARRDRVMMNDPDNGGAFTHDPMFLSIMNNPQAVHRVAQLIDANHDRLPDVVVGGVKATLVDSYELLLNSGGDLALGDKPFELDELDYITASGIADLDGDFIDDIVVGQFNTGNLNYVLTGTDELGADAGAPVIGHWEQLGSAMVGETVSIRARIHDNKNPTKPHDWLLEDGKRLMPFIEYALDLPNPPTEMEFDTLSQNGETTQVPTEWTGEYMHKGSFEVPLSLTLAYRFCAIDHAGNRACSPPYWLDVDQAVCGDAILTEPEECDDPNDDTCIDCFICGNGVCSEGEENCPEDCKECGNGIVEEPDEECDDPNDPNCNMCLICGNGICSPGEECPEDCGTCGDGVVSGNEECDDPNDPNCIMCFVCGNGVCSVGEEPYCPEDCNNNPVCGDGVIEPPEECDDPNDTNCNLCQVCGNGICSMIEQENNLCPEDCDIDETAGPGTDTDMCDSAGADPETCLDDDGCGCVTGDNYNSAWYSLALLGLLGLRRRRN